MGLCKNNVFNNNVLYNVIYLNVILCINHNFD